jgi:hypothetical protein
VVTGESGRLLRIKWSTGEESTIVPGTGSVSVVGRARVSSAPKKVTKAVKAPRTAVKRTVVKKATPAKRPVKVAKATKAAKVAKAPVKKAAKVAKAAPVKKAAKVAKAAPVKKAAKVTKAAKAPARSSRRK